MDGGELASGLLLCVCVCVCVFFSFFLFDLSIYTSSVSKECNAYPSDLLRK